MKQIDEKYKAPGVSYLQFIWNVSINRNLLLGCMFASIALFLIFKLFYPYPDFFGDSYSYIYAAKEHSDINIWPIGYSKFLSVIHDITPSDNLLVGIQYFGMQIVLLHFLFTLLYFFPFSTWQRNIFYIFIFINPFTLYLCNTVNSDAIFGIFSVLWIVLLIWVVQRPRLHQIFGSSLLLFACFTIRNNAYYYPLVGTIAYLLSQQPLWRKIAGIAMPVLFIVPFILYTREAAFKMTGTRQYSLFTGWQLANNALYMYDQIEVDSLDLPTKEARDLNQYALQYIRRVNPSSYRTALEEYVGNFFIRQPEAPLKQYYGSHYIFKTKNDNIINWARASAAFEPFGKALILQHPIAYSNYFVLPNIKHYFIPPLSHIGLYNYGQNEIDPIAQAWFKYPTNKISCASYSFQGDLLLIYIGLFLFVNIYYLWNIVKFTFRNGFGQLRMPFIASHIFILTFLILNFLFSITSTVNILRYQYVPLCVLAAFGLTLGSYLDQLSPKTFFRKAHHVQHRMQEINT